MYNWEGKYDYVKTLNISCKIILTATSFWQTCFMPFIKFIDIFCCWPYLNVVRLLMSHLMRLSLMMSHVSSWEKLPNPIGDTGWQFFWWVDIFTFEEDVFISLSTTPYVHSNL